MTGLDRFVEAQAGSFGDALQELGRGRKTTHWMWFVFPQLRGLGRSPMAERYGIRSLDEARDYLAHPVLGPRYRQAARVAVSADAGSATALLGPVDALKLRSSATVFLRAGETEVCQAVLDRWYGGEPDSATDRLLARMGGDASGSDGYFAAPM